MCASDDIMNNKDCLTSLVPQVKTRSGGYLGHGWEELGGRNFGIDSLKSMNRNMENKRIVLRELSCRTASELPAPELPAAVEAIWPQSGSSSSVLRELNWRQS